MSFFHFLDNLDEIEMLSSPQVEFYICFCLNYLVLKMPALTRNCLIWMDIVDIFASCSNKTIIFSVFFSGYSFCQSHRHLYFVWQIFFYIFCVIFMDIFCFEWFCRHIFFFFWLNCDSNDQSCEPFVWISYILWFYIEFIFTSLLFSWWFFHRYSFVIFSSIWKLVSYEFLLTHNHLQFDASIKQFNVQNNR